MKKESKVFSIDEIDPLHADAIYLLYESAKEIRPLYDPDFDPNRKMPTNLPAVPGSVYLIARLDGIPVGSVALRPYENTTGEVIRMYVLLVYRREQIAQRLLEQLEVVAIDLGYRILRLETGNRQSAAMALYKRCGYKRIPAFGKYEGDPTSVCFEKEIVLGSGS